MHTGADLLTDKQKNRPLALFGGDDHVEVKVNWGTPTSAGYRQPDRAGAGN